MGLKEGRGGSYNEALSYGYIRWKEGREWSCNEVFFAVTLGEMKGGKGVITRHSLRLPWQEGRKEGRRGGEGGGRRGGCSRGTGCSCLYFYFRRFLLYVPAYALRSIRRFCVGDRGGGSGGDRERGWSRSR